MANAATEKKNEPDAQQHAPIISAPSTVPHTNTQSTLAPTSEYVRYLLLALPARYSFRSVLEGFFGKDTSEKFRSWRDGLIDRIFKPTPGALESASQRDDRRGIASGIAYDYALGTASLWLTFSYSSLVYRDIKSMFCETVGLELGKPAEKVTFFDIGRSKNKIVTKTMDNFKWKCVERFGADILFFTRPILRKFLPFTPPVGDLMIGVKAAQALNDTWKRKTTLFEDLVTFVNNKINPRSGLGQPIGLGEVFDLYQRYADMFQSDKMFRNVLERGTGEGVVWAKIQPVFQRMADLMNHTYAYKHHSIIDPAAGIAIHQADFALPKFVYLLGQDLIDPYKPEQTLAYIEIINARGADAVKQAQAMFAQGVDPEAVVARFNLILPKLEVTKLDPGANGVIAKGSTMQMEAAEKPAPASKIDRTSIRHSGVAAEAALERGAPA